ncbi:MAG: hypothetical protein Phyf2KO_03300 [Phycisphaerales bacterium]
MIAFLGIFPAILVPVRVAQNDHGLPVYAYFVIFVVLVALFVMIAKLLWRHLFADRFIDTLKRHRYCPSCVYDLSGVIPDFDGYKVCPECGSSWHIPADMQPKPIDSNLNQRRKRHFLWPLR